MAESAEPFGDGSTRWVPGASWRREAGDRLGPPAASCRGLASIAPSARASTSAPYLPIGKGSTSAPRATATSTEVVKRSEEHTSELQSLMRISYAVFCLKKKKNTHNNSTQQ